MNLDPLDRESREANVFLHLGEISSILGKHTRKERLRILKLIAMENNMVVSPIDTGIFGNSQKNKFVGPRKSEGKPKVKNKKKTLNVQPAPYKRSSGWKKLQNEHALLLAKLKSTPPEDSSLRLSLLRQNETDQRNFRENFLKGQDPEGQSPLFGGTAQSVNSFERTIEEEKDKSIRETAPKGKAHSSGTTTTTK